MALINSSALKQAIQRQLSDCRTTNQQHLTPDAVRDNLYIVDDNLEVVKFTPKRAQLHFRKHRTGRDLILKARQLGFSTEIQADDYVASITSRNSCATLAHDNATTAKLRRMATRFYRFMPEHLRPERGLDNANTTTYLNTGSEVTIATAGSRNIGRGGTYNRIHGSEVAFWKNAEGIISGLMQGLTLDGLVVFESTANGAQGYFYDTCMEALQGDSNWTLHFYAWWWDDKYKLPLEPKEVLTYNDEEQYLVDTHNLSSKQIKWRRFKQRELKGLFLQEYPEDPITCFLQSGATIFNPLPQQLLLPPAYNSEHVYVCGIDWGQADDYTVVSVFDVTDYREVAMLRIRHKSWDSMVQDIVSLCQEWRIEKLMPELNSIGAVAIEMLQSALNTIEYDNGYYPVVEAFRMTNKSKDDLVKLMQTGLDEDLILLDDAVANQELRAFQAKQLPSGVWSYSAPSGQHDDTVIARLLANKATYQLR